MTLKLCQRCRTMKNIKGKMIICKRCEDDVDKSKSFNKKNVENFDEGLTRTFNQPEYEKGRNEAIEEFIRLINDVERRAWDCNCSIVNSDADSCKVCGENKEESYDNNRFEDLKELVGKMK